MKLIYLTFVNEKMERLANLIMKNKKTSTATIAILVLIFLPSISIYLNQQNTRTKLNRAIDKALKESMEEDLDSRLISIPSSSSKLDTSRIYTQMAFTYCDKQTQEIKTDTLKFHHCAV